MTSQRIKNAPGFGKPQGFASKLKSDPCGMSKGACPTTQMITKAELCRILNISIQDFEAECKKWSIVIDEDYTSAQVVAMREHFGVKPWGDRPAAPTATIPTARTNALVLSTQSHDAMSILQSAGLQNAAAYVQRKQIERNAVVDKVSDAIAYLSDPDVLEADIMSAAAAKVQARSGAWGYQETAVDFDTLFALPASSQRLLGEA